MHSSPAIYSYWHKYKTTALSDTSCWERLAKLQAIDDRVEIVADFFKITSECKIFKTSTQSMQLSQKVMLHIFYYFDDFPIIKVLKNLTSFSVGWFWNFKRDLFAFSKMFLVYPYLAYMFSLLQRILWVIHCKQLIIDSPAYLGSIFILSSAVSRISGIIIIMRGGKIESV